MSRIGFAGHPISPVEARKLIIKALPRNLLGQLKQRMVGIELVHEVREQKVASVTVSRFRFHCHSKFSDFSTGFLQDYCINWSWTLQRKRRNVKCFQAVIIFFRVNYLLPLNILIGIPLHHFGDRRVLSGQRLTAMPGERRQAVGHRLRDHDTQTFLIRAGCKK